MIEMTFKDEYGYLIHLLYSALHHEEPKSIPKGLSIEKVLGYGIEHEVANIAFLSAEKLDLPESVSERWRREYYKGIMRDTMQNAARSEITSALHSKGIYTLEVQGTVVKRYYPQSHMRMMSDIDFIIPKEKLHEAADVMSGLGYVSEITHKDTEIFAVKNQMNIELHTDFFSENRKSREILSRPFSSVTLHDDYSAQVSETVFYLFHLLHTIKHLTEYKGVGIRRIIDLYYLEDALKEKADFQYIDKVLKEHGLYEVKEELIAVKDHWFCGIVPKKDISDTENEILSSGNHGTDENYYKHKFKNEEAIGGRHVKLKYFRSFLFPDKETLYRSHPFFAKHRFPTVLCYICRIGSLFNPEKLKFLKTVYLRLKVKTK